MTEPNILKPLLKNLNEKGNILKKIQQKASRRKQTKLVFQIKLLIAILLFIQNLLQRANFLTRISLAGVV